MNVVSGHGNGGYCGERRTNINIHADKSVENSQALKKVYITLKKKGRTVQNKI